jgi:hypothetical protein
MRHRSALFYVGLPQFVIACAGEVTVRDFFAYEGVCHQDAHLGIKMLIEGKMSILRTFSKR